MKNFYFLIFIFLSNQLFSQEAEQKNELRPLSQFVGYYDVGTKPNKPFFKSRWYLKEGKLYTIYDSDIDRPFVPYVDGKLNYNVVYDESDLPEISEEDTTYYVVLKFKDDQLDQFKIIRPRSEWKTDLYGYRIQQLDPLAVDPEREMTLEHTTDHFKFAYSEQDHLFVEQFSKKIESVYGQLLKDFKLPKLPLTTIKIYPDLENYHNGVLTPGAPEWQKGRVWTKTEIKLVSPVYLRDERKEIVSDDLITHEFIHILHWNKMGDPNQIPKWLWEGVALYKGCCQWENIDQLDYLSKGNFPSIKQINRNGEFQYELGYYLIEFIDKKWGWEKVLQLIDRNGDIKECLGISVKTFEKDFYKYLSEEYLNQ